MPGAAQAQPQEAADTGLFAGMQLPDHLPDLPARFAIWGLLHEDARVYTQHGRVCLQVLVAQQLHQHPDACPVLATYIYPDTGTPQATEMAAKSRAHQLRTHAEVIVSGEVLLPGLYHGRAVNVLHDVRGITPAETAIHHHHGHGG